MSSERDHMLGKSSTRKKQKIYHNGDLNNEKHKNVSTNLKIKIFSMSCVSYSVNFVHFTVKNDEFNSKIFENTHRDRCSLSKSALYSSSKQVFIYSKLEFPICVFNPSETLLIKPTNTNNENNFSKFIN